MRTMEKWEKVMVYTYNAWPELQETWQEAPTYAR